MTMLDTALSYAEAGLTVLPNDPIAKYPVDLKGWESVEVTEALIKQWWRWWPNRCIGVRDKEGLDFDNKGVPSADDLYAEWAALVEELAPGLVERLLLESTPSGGYHVVWGECDAIAGNQKLAERLPTSEEKQAHPDWRAVTLIETRGKKGQFQVAPSPGYTLLRGDWRALPEITPAERQIILDCARALTRLTPSRIEGMQQGQGERPGDKFNAEGHDQALDTLVKHGWQVVRAKGETMYLCRPGKDRGVSATFGHVAPGVLYVFSSNASPFEPNRAYSPFGVFTELEHGGDYKAAAKVLAEKYRMPPKNKKSQITAEEPQLKGTTYTTSPKPPIDVNDLLLMERKPTLWYAPKFLREGLGLIVGQPNVGKTPAAVQLAIAVATGGKWLGSVQCQQATVLYLGVEYSQQELIPLFDISRCGKQIPRGTLLVKTIEDDFPTTPEEALAELEWYLQVMDIRVIIIDVLTAFLPPEKFKQNVYRGDYSELKPYHRLALQYNAAILGVWHGSKRESDPRIMYNGSTGMWAACASRITMYTDPDQRVRIASFPRMGDRVDWALAQERTMTGHRWIISDSNPEPVCSPTELQIYRCIRQHAEKARPIGATTVAELTGISMGTVKSSLSRMYERNQIQTPRSGSGYYIEIATNETHVTPETYETNATLATDATLATSKDTLMVASFSASESAKQAGLQGLHQITESNESDDFWGKVPPSRRTNLRLYLRSRMPSDQERAKQLCAEYSLDYEEAKRKVEQQEENLP